MIPKQQISPPEYWQEFEDFCKRLFGEFWKVEHTIKKNGRNGQPQCGVDVYAILKGEESYWGIQCKGKDNYTKQKLTKAEIDEEIEKAKSFKPELGAFFFATTAPKDVEIEEHIRIRNIENRKNKGFSVELYCWGDLVDFLLDSEKTYQWYVERKQFVQNYQISLNLIHPNTDCIFRPHYVKVITDYQFPASNYSDSQIWQILLPDIPIEELEDEKEDALYPYSGMELLPIGLNNNFKEECTKTWQWCEIEVTNTSNRNISQFKIELYFDESFVFFSDCTFDNNRLFAFDITWINSINNRRVVFTNDERRVVYYQNLPGYSLLSGDSFRFRIKFMTWYDVSEAKIDWKFISEEKQESGVFDLQIEPVILVNEKTVKVKSRQEEKTEMQYYQYTYYYDETNPLLDESDKLNK